MSDEIKENKKHIKKVGTFTTGICLILIGITIFISLFIGIKILKYMIYAWPLILILIGTEIIYYSTKENIELKYDFWGVILLIILFFGSICGSAFSNIVLNNELRINQYIERNINI